MYAAIERPDLSMRELSIIVPTCDRPKDLQRCLARLLAQLQEIPESAWEVIVTDDSPVSSAKQTVAELSAAGCKWVAGPRTGPARNRNSAARVATGKWLLFVDDDCLPGPLLVRSYLQSAERHPGVRVFEGMITADRPKRHPLEECPLNQRGGNLWSCNFMIGRDFFLGVGGFDERFPHAAGEDWELCYRIKKGGEEIVFVPEAEVVHPWRPATAADYWRQRGRFMQANLIAMDMHPELRNYFTVWSVFKDIVRRYVKSWFRELQQCGGRLLVYEPLFLAAQVRRASAYFAYNLRNQN